MRQGEVASKGAWIGDPQGGVKASEPLILPDPSTRFARTSARLEALSTGNPMGPWLRFMAQLAAAQHLAATKLGPLRGPGLAAVEQAVDARMPPLAADGHRRDPAWRDGLALLLDGFDMAPAPAMAEMAKLRARAPGAVEALADGFLHGDVDPSDAGAVLFVAAALQVYFTRLAAALPASSLRLLPQRGLCPCCGSTPVSGRGDGLRSDAGNALPLLFAVLDRMEPCARGVHHLRRVALPDPQGDRGRSRRRQG